MPHSRFSLCVNEQTLSTTNGQCTKVTFDSLSPAVIRFPILKSKLWKHVPQGMPTALSAGY